MAQIKEDTVIAVWKNSVNNSEIANVTAAGYNAVFSACWYINYISYGQDWEKVGHFIS